MTTGNDVREALQELLERRGDEIAGEVARHVTTRPASTFRQIDEATVTQVVRGLLAALGEDARANRTTALRAAFRAGVELLNAALNFADLKLLQDALYRAVLARVDVEGLPGPAVRAAFDWFRELGLVCSLHLLIRREAVIQQQAGEIEVQLATVRQEVQERKAAESRLLAAQRHLIEAEKMAALGNLVAGVAHEINTPIGVGITAASTLSEHAEALLRAYRAGAMTRSDLERFLDETRQTAAILLANLQRAGEQVQSFRQVAVDQSSEELRTFAVAAYVESVVRSLQPELKRGRHTVDVSVPPDLQWRTYPGALAQILTNIVINATLHAFEPGQPGRLTIAARARDGLVTLELTDDGMGIAPEHLSRLFEPFFTTARDRGGSGLGLHIVYNLVSHRLGGTIRCENAPGGGARFVIEAPQDGSAAGSGVHPIVPLVAGAAAPAD